jgi:hypothetical protein
MPARRPPRGGSGGTAVAVHALDAGGATIGAARTVTPPPASTGAQARAAQFTKRLMNVSEVSQTSCQPLSIVSAWPRPFISMISVTPGLSACCS